MFNTCKFIWSFIVVHTELLGRLTFTYINASFTADQLTISLSANVRRSLSEMMWQCQRLNSSERTSHITFSGKLSKAPRVYRTFVLLWLDMAHFLIKNRMKLSLWKKNAQIHNRKQSSTSHPRNLLPGYSVLSYSNWIRAARVFGHWGLRRQGQTLWKDIEHWDNDLKDNRVTLSALFPKTKASYS